MKKNNFIQGAFIATLGIVITKVIGILYVIPFYWIIGDKGGALYGYAYNIYNIFLNISSAGIPMAISKIVSEYNALGLYEDKKQAFKIGKNLAIILSAISFFILFVFAPVIAYLIIGDVKGGNTIEEITLVIRIISSAIIIVPILSIYRGYFQGHKYIKPTSISQIIEQLFRVMVILGGSFIALKILNLSLTTSVGIAVFGATVGAFSSYIYMLNKYYKNKEEFDVTNKKRTIDNQTILKQIIIYAVPLVCIDVFKTLYNSVDIVTLVKTLVGSFNYNVTDAESIMSVISTWGLKLNMIITSIGSGIVISLVPNLSENYATNNKNEINNKVNKALQVLLFFILPMTVGLSVLSKPVWAVFYGFNDLSSSTFSYSVFTALFLSLFLVTITIMHILKQYKCVIISLISGVSTKLILNIPLMYLFNRFMLPAHYGSITATIIGYVVPFIINLLYLKYKFNINYSKTFKNIIHIITCTILMLVSIIVLRLFIPVCLSSRFENIFLVIGYTIVGIITYIVYMHKTKLLYELFGDKIYNKIKKISFFHK